MGWIDVQTHMTFGKEFTQAVEQKQVAQQGSSNPFPLSYRCFDPLLTHISISSEAERAKFIVERVSFSLPPPDPSPPEPISDLFSIFSVSSPSKRDRPLLCVPREKERRPLSSQGRSTRLEKDSFSSEGSRLARISLPLLPRFVLLSVELRSSLLGLTRCLCYSGTKRHLPPERGICALVRSCSINRRKHVWLAISVFPPPPISVSRINNQIQSKTPFPLRSRRLPLLLLPH